MVDDPIKMKKTFKSFNPNVSWKSFGSWNLSLDFLLSLLGQRIFFFFCGIALGLKFTS